MKHLEWPELLEEVLEGKDGQEIHQTAATLKGII